MPPVARRLSGAQRAVVGVLCVGGFLTLACVGGAVGLGLAGAARAKQEIGAEAGSRKQAAESADLTRVRLEQVRDRLERGLSLPQTLPEAPPDDAWGRPVRYRASSEQRALLVSSGPDGNFNTTADNVVVEVNLR